MARDTLPRHFAFWRVRGTVEGLGALDDGRKAYNIGRAELLKGRVLNSRKIRGKLWLPLGLVLHRAMERGDTLVDFSAPPTWDSLALYEQRALTICWRFYGHGTLDDAVSGDAFFLLEEFLRFRTCWRSDVTEVIDQALKTGFFQKDQIRSVDLAKQLWQAEAAQPFHCIAFILAASAGAEANFGHLRHTLPDPYVYTVSSDQLDITWLEQNRDPAFWHEYAAHFCDEEHFGPRQWVGWIVAQPDCDLATAATVFMRCDGPRHLGGPGQPHEYGTRRKAEDGPGSCQRDDLDVQLCEDIVRRAEEGFYTSNRFKPLDEITGLDNLHPKAYPRALLRLSGQETVESVWLMIDEDTFMPRLV